MISITTPRVSGEAGELQENGGGAPTWQEFVTPDLLDLLSDPQKKNYRSHIVRFAEEHADESIALATTLTLRPFVKAAHDRSKANGHSGKYSQEHCTRGLRWVFKAAVDGGHRLVNPAMNLELPRRPESPRRPLTAREQDLLFAVATTTGQNPELDELLLWNLFETAFRVEGLQTVTVRSLDLEVCAIRGEEKMDRRPLIPVSGNLMRANVAHAVANGADMRDPTASIFYVAPGRPMSLKHFESLFGRVHRHEPSLARVSSHWIRHTTLEAVRVLRNETIMDAYAGHYPSNKKPYGKVRFAELRRVHGELFGSDPTPSSVRLDVAA